MQVGRQNFRVRTGGRIVKVIRHERVKVKPTTWTWLLMPKKYKRGPRKGQPVPRLVEFGIVGISAMRWRKGWWLWPGCLTIDAPPDNDPWWPDGKQRPHRFRFAYRSAQEARLLQVAWVIQLAYVQATSGLLLAKHLPDPRPVPPTLWQRALAAVRRPSVA